VLLNRKLFFVRERVAVLKLVDTFDILDPETQQPIGIAKEEPGGFVKFLRLIMKRQTLPTTLNVYEDETRPPLFTIKRPFTFLRSKLSITDSSGASLGYMKSKLLAVGGGLTVYDTTDHQVADVKGDWKGWNFQFLDEGGKLLGTFTKKWTGVGRELLTTADSYVVQIDDAVSADPKLATLLLSAALSIDVVYREKRR
jgi:uncharacterized protein YxjI